MDSLFPQGIQPGGGLYFSLQQVLEVEADDVFHLAGKLGLDFQAAGAGIIVALQQAQYLLRVHGEGGGKGVVKVAVRAEHAAGGGAEIVGNRFQRLVAGNTFAQLGAVTGAFQQMQLEVAQGEVFIFGLGEPVERVQHKLKERRILLVLGRELVDELGDIQPAGGQPEVVLNGEESVDGLGAGDGIDVAAAARKRYGAVGEQLEVARHLAFRLAQAFSEALDFPEVRGKKSEDAVRFAQFRFFDDDGFRLVLMRV